MFLKEMAELRNPRSKTKANIIIDLMVSPRLRNDIISKYSKQSSKGVYRHLRDLKSEKIIREVSPKGAKMLLVLNKHDIKATSRAFEYLLDVKRSLRMSFDRAFVECAISAYGDFPINNPRLADANYEIPDITLDALLRAERPDINDQLMAKVFSAIETVRGNMTVEDRLAYISLVDRLSESAWSPDKESPLSLSMPFLFSTVEQEKKDGEMNAEVVGGIWNVVIRKLIFMAAGRRKNFLNGIKDSRELKLLNARLELYVASVLPVNEIKLMDKLDRRFLTPERQAQFEKERIRDIDRLPDIYRKEAEGNNAAKCQ
jgi:hypothetical protein